MHEQEVTSPGATRLLIYSAAALIVTYIVGLAWLSSPGFPDHLVFHSHRPYLSDQPVGEDGFYMLTVAENIATQGKILYNRGLVTTGIQPLGTFLFAGVDWWVRLFHGSEWDFIRWVMVLGVALFVLFAWQIGRIAWALAPPSCAATAFSLGFVLVVTDYTLFRLFTYGLETGLYLCCVALCFSCIGRIAASGRASHAQAAILGLAGGLSGLARIDFGLLFAILLTLMLARRWITPVKAVLCGLTALVIVSPWFLFLHRVTGSWIPSSGKAESGIVTLATLSLRAKLMFFMTAMHLEPWSYGGLSRTANIATLAGLALIGWLGFSAAGKRVRAEAPLTSKLAALWLPGFVVLMVVYAVFFSSMHFYYRYMAVITVLTIPLLAVTLASAGWVQRHLVLVAAALICLFTFWTGRAFHTGRVSNTSALAAGYVRAQYPSAHVGAFQSGVVGYFNKNVENLDGKLNLAAWDASQHHGLPSFIDREGIVVLVDWPSVIADYLPRSYLDAEWQPCPVPMTGSQSVCLMRKPNSIAAPQRNLPPGAPRSNAFTVDATKGAS